MTENLSASFGDVEFLALFRSPFLLPSLLLHLIIFFLALHGMKFYAPKSSANTPITVQLLEGRDGGSDNKSIGPGKGPGGPRTAPKLGVPIPPAQRTGKLDSGSLETSVASNAVETPPPPKPVVLPGPKVLATEGRHDTVNAKETSPDSLVRLPTKESPTRLPGGSAAELAPAEKNIAALKGTGEGVGIRALKEGAQIPGALKGTGSGIGPYGVPGGSRSGSGIAGSGSGVGAGGGSLTGLKGISNADYDEYIARLKKRVESVWKYPDDVSGIQKVAISFTIDRAGKLIQAKIIESSDARLNASAETAMRRASPFPPLPESLKDLANEPLRIIFTVSIRVRS
jgi:TonB family protein